MSEYEACVSRLTAKGVPYDLASRLCMVNPDVSLQEALEERRLPKEESSYKLSNDKEITIRPEDTNFGIPAGDEWYVWWRKGLPIPIEKEDKFQAQNRFAFSPLPYDALSFEGMMLFLLVASFVKTPEGQRRLTAIIMRYLESITSIIGHIQSPAKTHWAVGLNAQTSTAAILHRFGIIDDGGYEKIVDQSKSVFDKEWTANFVNVMTGHLTTLVEGSITTTKTTPKGMTTTEMGGLAAILKGLGISK